MKTNKNPKAHLRRKFICKAQMERPWSLVMALPYKLKESCNPTENPSPSVIHGKPELLEAAFNRCLCLLSSHSS